MLIVSMLSLVLIVNMLSGIKLKVTIPNVIMLRFNTLTVFTLRAHMVSVIMLTVVMLTVVMLTVVAPFKILTET
jgi:hypothetical protein